MKKEYNDQKTQVYSQKVRVQESTIPESYPKSKIRFYVPEAELHKEITLSKEQLRHLHVLRLKEGEIMHVFNGKGKEFELTYSEKVRTGKVLLTKEASPKQEPAIHITLATAIPKGHRIDFLVEKVSELGITNLVPIIFNRSIVKPHDAKIDRLRKITIEACCQSERSIVPTVSEPISFTELLKTTQNYNQTFICHKTGKALKKYPLASGNVLVIVGPEGDFTNEELTAAQEAKCTPISLSPTILRIETAAIAAVSQIVAQSL